MGWITTWNTRCGIATYAEHLVARLPEKVSILAAEATERRGADGADVDRCWVIGETDTLDALSYRIEALGLDTLVIQFNYGFFNLELLNDFLLHQATAGRTLIIVLHSTTDPPHAPHKRLSDLKVGLARCDRILVHAVADLNRLKALGLIENVALFPHGVLEIDEAEAKGHSDGALHIASFGFFLPHKGLLELIEAMDILNRKGVSFRLHMVNAEYPAPESRALIQRATDLIEKLQLTSFVTLTTDFLSDQQSLACLQASDLIVFPYQLTGESASGAVRYGIASGRSVAVTPIPIFDDVLGAVWRLSGTGPEAIAEGILRYWRDQSENPMMLAEQAAKAKKWREAHGYHTLARRLFRMAVALRNQRSFG
jgi:glycosyltransferase involved in cell wall biosynthesis